MFLQVNFLCTNIDHDSENRSVLIFIKSGSLTGCLPILPIVNCKIVLYRELKIFKTASDKRLQKIVLTQT